MHEDSTGRTKVAELLRFNTSQSGDEQIRLKEYVCRMKEGQDYIYYITGESIAAVSSSPFLATMRRKGLEVLYTVDPVDEHCVQQLRETDGKQLIEHKDEQKKLEELKAEFAEFTKRRNFSFRAEAVEFVPGQKSWTGMGSTAATRTL